jgi:hypothetical protein
VLAREAADLQRQRLRGMRIEAGGDLDDPGSAQPVARGFRGFDSFVLTHRGLMAPFSAR